MFANKNLMNVKKNCREAVDLFNMLSLFIQRLQTFLFFLTFVTSVLHTQDRFVTAVALLDVLASQCGNISVVIIIYSCCVTV